MKILLVFLTLSLSISAHALTDYSFEGIFRSFPVGGFVRANGGYSWSFWGKPGTKSPAYGYVRGMGAFQTSGIINAATARAEFFPISILGIYAGRTWQYRNSSFLDTFDCDVVVCDGRLERDFIGYKAAFGMFGFFATVDYKKSVVKMKNRTGTFADETVTLLARGGSDVNESTITIIGYNITEDHKVGLIQMRNRMTYIQNSSEMLMGIYQMPFFKTQQITMGVGKFHTRDNQDVLSALVLWKMIPLQGAVLF